MVNKNYFLTAGLLTAMAVAPAFAQESSQAQYAGRDMTYRGHSYDALDSAYIPAGRMEQQRQYLNHEYAFPAKPRNMWELGLSAGMMNVDGDVISKTPFTAVTPLDAMGFSAYLRKAIGYSFSWRLQYVYGKASGFDYRSRSAHEFPWNSNPDYQNTSIHSNYVTTSHELTLQLMYNINNIKFNKAKNSLSLYGFIGGGAFAYNTKVAVKNGQGQAFDFANAPQVAGGLRENRKDFNEWYKDQLKDVNENDYVRVEGKDAQKLTDDLSIAPVITGGIGVQFKLGGRVSLNVENKMSYTRSDLLDGVQKDPSGVALSADKDFLNYASIGLSFNLGSKARRVAPLWWVNPIDHVYSELSNPRHMTLPAPILPDSDGDGVTDQFDKCPDTPAGVQVDAHGCPLDTDGDGVPDYLDKEKITPTECQPVDADGVGKCPEPECCKGMQGGCNIMANSLCFSANSANLSAEHKNILANLAAQMKASPTCKVVVIGNQGNSKLQQQRSWEKVNAVIKYMTETQNINRNQFIFQYQGTSGDVNCVMFRAAQPGEEGPTNVPPPHPQLGSK